MSYEATSAAEPMFSMHGEFRGYARGDTQETMCFSALTVEYNGTKKIVLDPRIECTTWQGVATATFRFAAAPHGLAEMVLDACLGGGPLGDGAVINLRDDDGAAASVNMAGALVMACSQRGDHLEFTIKTGREGFREQLPWPVKAAP